MPSPGARVPTDTRNDGAVAPPPARGGLCEVNPSKCIQPSCHQSRPPTSIALLRMPPSRVLRPIRDDMDGTIPHCHAIRSKGKIHAILLTRASTGLAVGDALGAAVEFKHPGTFKPVTGYRDGGPHRLAAGEWTDDTSMALALADSIVTAGWDLDDQARRYIQWWRKGTYSVNGFCFDIGHTTCWALSRFEQLADARKSGDTSERASGNGSIMRLVPVAIRYAEIFQTTSPSLGV